VVDPPLVEHLRAAGVADLGLGILVRRVALNSVGENESSDSARRMDGRTEGRR